MYSLAGIDLSSLAFTAGRQENSDVAISGFFDMPARLGKTFHDWANEDGVEPYVAASEIFFGGRSLELTGYIKGSDKDDCNAKLSAFVTLIDSLTGLVPLVTPWGTFQVYVNAAILADRLAPHLLGLKIPMREPVVNMIGTIPIGTSSEFGIDGISFKNLGGESLKLSGDRWNRTAPKSDSLTVYGKEKALITKKAAPELTLSLGLRHSTFSGLKTQVQNLMALFSAPGIRQLTYKNDKLRSFFVKDGFKASAVYLKRNTKFCVLDIKIIEVDSSGSLLRNLIDSEMFIVIDSDNNTIKVNI